VEFHHPLKTSAKLESLLKTVRSYSESLDVDRSLAEDIKLLSSLIVQGKITENNYEIFNLENNANI
jgi:histidine ammonia-lyase